MPVHHFRAKIYAIGINRCVDVPQWVSKALGGQTHIRVTGMVGGEGFRSNLAPRGGGMHRLSLLLRPLQEEGAKTLF